MNKHTHESGAVNPLLITSIIISLIAAALGGFAAWAYSNYMNQKNNVDGIVAAAVADAKKVQKEEDEKNFAEREKQPVRQYVGPSDFGSVTFNYPKTWSVYIAKDGKSGGSYEAYFQPGIVPTVSLTQPYATRVIVDDKQYEQVTKSYEALVKKGALKSSPITIGSFTGIRLDGEFTKDRKGTAVIFKIRDKTLTVASDAEAFRGDFYDIILKSLTFIP